MTVDDNGNAFDKIIISAQEASGGLGHWTDFQIGSVVSYTAQNIIDDFTINSLALLANDTDVDGDVLSIQIDDDNLYLANTATVVGTVSLDVDGNVFVDLDQSYEITGDISNAATFNYTVIDGNGGSDQGVATIDIALGTVTNNEIHYGGEADDGSIIGTQTDDVIGFEKVAVIDGDEGEDTLLFGSSDTDIDMAAILNGAVYNDDDTQTSILNIEKLDLSETGDHILSNLSVEDVIAITDDDNTLKITGSDDINNEDEIRLNMTDDGTPDSEHWYDTGVDVVEDGITYSTYTNAADTSVNLLIDDNIEVNNI